MMANAYHKLISDYVRKNTKETKTKEAPKQKVEK